MSKALDIEVTENVKKAARIWIDFWLSEICNFYTYCNCACKSLFIAYFNNNNLMAQVLYVSLLVCTFLVLPHLVIDV